MSACVFLSLVFGNYFVFSPDKPIQSLGTDFLIPVYFVSVDLLRVAPFDEGLWAFSAFCLLLLSLSAVRIRERGLIDSILDSLTLIGPAVLVCFEIGVYCFIPSYFYAPATNFVGRAPLGEYVTNCFVLISSVIVLFGGILLKIVRSKQSKGGNFVV
ncbi:MAG: hypothetical protein JRN54_11430 [Nitrososphaerota archaeon]|nr:hypothetical protein [Nitrososphaerota archaeon]